MKPIIIALLLTGAAWGKQLPVSVPPLLQPHHKAPPGVDITGTEVEWDQYSPDLHHPGYYCAFKHKKLLKCGLPTLMPIAQQIDPDIIFSSKVNYPCRAPESSANYGCKFWDAGPIGFARADYYEAHQAIVNVLDHAQLNNAEWENLDALAHAVNNVYLFLGTSKATETDAAKAKLELEALHIGEKLAKYHIPTHEESMDELLRKMDGWGKKL